MYRVEHSYDRDVWNTIYTPNISGPDYMLGNAHITQSVDEIDSFTFDMYSGNEHFNLLEPLTSYIRVTDTDTSTIEFEGRVIGVTPTMDDDGVTYKSITCESCEAFLLDTYVSMCVSEMDAQTITDLDLSEIGDNILRVNAVAFLEYVFDMHNSQVDSVRQIQLGTVDIDSTVTYDMENTYGTTTRDVLMDFLRVMNLDNNQIDGVSVNFYQLFTIHVYGDGNGGLLCDVADYWNNTTEGTLSLGTNLGAITCEPDYTDIVTCIRPLGDEYTYSANGNKYRLTLNDVLQFYGTIPPELETVFEFDTTDEVIRNIDAVSDYGEITKPYHIDGLSQENDGEHGALAYWMSQEQAEAFIKQCLVYLSQHNRPTQSVSANAYDLSRIGYNYTRFGLFQNWDIENSLIGVDENLPIVRRTIDFDNPAASKIEFGKYAPRESAFEKMQFDRMNAQSEGTNHDNYVGEDGKRGEGEGGGVYYVEDVVQYVPYTKESGMPDSQYRYCWNITRTSASDPNFKYFSLWLDLQDISNALGFADTLTVESYTDASAKITSGFKIGGVHFSITDICMDEQYAEAYTRRFYQDLKWGICVYNNLPVLKIQGTFYHDNATTGGPISTDGVTWEPFLQIHVMRESSTPGPVDIIAAYNMNGQEKYASSRSFPSRGKLIFQESVIDVTPVMKTSADWGIN